MSVSRLLATAAGGDVAHATPAIARHGRELATVDSARAAGGSARAAASGAYPPPPTAGGAAKSRKRQRRCGGEEEGASLVASDALEAQGPRLSSPDGDAAVMAADEFVHALHRSSTVLPGSACGRGGGGGGGVHGALPTAEPASPPTVPRHTLVREQPPWHDAVAAPPVDGAAEASSERAAPHGDLHMSPFSFLSLTPLPVAPPTDVAQSPLSHDVLHCSGILPSMSFLVGSLSFPSVSL